MRVTHCGGAISILVDAGGAWPLTAQAQQA
jgi:hypothetical protein